MLHPSSPALQSRRTSYVREKPFLTACATERACPDRARTDTVFVASPGSVATRLASPSAGGGGHLTALSRTTTYHRVSKADVLRVVSRGVASASHGGARRAAHLHLAREHTPPGVAHGSGVASKAPSTSVPQFAAQQPTGLATTGSRHGLAHQARLTVMVVLPAVPHDTPECRRRQPAVKLTQWKMARKHTSHWSWAMRPIQKLKAAKRSIHA